MTRLLHIFPPMLILTLVVLMNTGTAPYLLSTYLDYSPAQNVDSSGTQIGGVVDTLAQTALEAKSEPRGKRPYIVIDRYANTLFLRTQDSVLLKATCSTGSGGELLDSTSGRLWKFETPSGVYGVTTRLVNPWWRKPDWAFIEEGQPVPKKESDRYDNEMLGDFALGFGDGYFIHGTLYERLLGVAVTHGCVRLGARDLNFLYEHTQIGTKIYVF